MKTVFTIPVSDHFDVAVDGMYRTFHAGNFNSSAYGSFIVSGLTMTLGATYKIPF